MFDETRAELSAAVHDARAAWSWTTTLWLLAFLAALVAPAVLPLSGRMPDLAEFVYLALAAVGLAYAVGLAGIPSLGQGAFLGIGAFSEALLRTKAGWPLLPSLVAAVAITTGVGVLTGLATGRLRSAFVAVSTWILSWILLLLLTSFPGISGGAQGLVLPEATVLGHDADPDRPLRDRDHAPRARRPRARRDRPAGARARPRGGPGPAARGGGPRRPGRARTAGRLHRFGRDRRGRGRARSRAAPGRGRVVVRAGRLVQALRGGDPRRRAAAARPDRRPARDQRVLERRGADRRPPRPPARAARGDAHRLRDAARPRPRRRGPAPGGA